jgi:hypothetical protein
VAPQAGALLVPAALAEGKTKAETIRCRKRSPSIGQVHQRLRTQPGAMPRRSRSIRNRREDSECVKVCVSYRSVRPSVDFFAAATSALNRPTGGARSRSAGGLA